MNRSICFSTWKLVVALLLVQAGIAGAAEVRVFSTIGVRAILQELGPRFESATGHKLILTFDVANALKRRIDADEQFDVAILTVPVMDELVKQNKIVAATRVVIARGGAASSSRIPSSRSPSSSNASPS